MDNNSRIDLGFLEKCEKPWLLLNTYFPSKVGGRPAWLDVESIPSNYRLKCAECGKQSAFLCQIYAPLDTCDTCFHRTIYVFVCLDSQCWKSNSTKAIKVFRCQLPRENKYYEPTPPDEETPLDEIRSSVKLCRVCGCHGSLSCSVCKAVNYCSKEHQKIDWTRGEHKITCGSNVTSPIGDEKHKYLLEEFDLAIEPEEIDESTASESEADTEARRLREYEEFIEKRKQNPQHDDSLDNVSEAEFEKYTSQLDDDKSFHKFKERIANDPEQVIRFQRSGQPLWITNSNQLNDNDVPACETCHGPRIFEFQIMPQLLNSFKDLDIDWGVLAIYTCTRSCNTTNEYVDEYCFKQDISENLQP